MLPRRAHRQVNRKENMIESVDLVQEREYPGGVRVYNPAEYGGLREADWVVPIGTIWKGASLELRFNRQPDTVCGWQETYLLSSARHDFPPVEIHAFDMLGTAGDVMEALGLSAPVAVKANGRKTESTDLKGSLHIATAAIPDGVKLRQRGAKQEISFTGRDAKDLLSALIAGAAHLSRHYFRIIYAGDAKFIEITGESGVARVRNDLGCRSEYWTAVRHLLTPELLDQIPHATWAMS